MEQHAAAHLCGTAFPVPERVPPPVPPFPDFGRACAGCTAVLPRAGFYVTDRDDAGGRDDLCRACRDEANRRERIARQRAVAW